MKYVSTSTHPWDKLKGHKERGNYIVDMIPIILQENGGTMRIYSLSEELTGRRQAISAWFQQENGSYAKNALSKLRDKVEFFSYKPGKRLTFARLRFHEIKGIDMAREDKSPDIDKCLQKFLDAVKQKAENDLGDKIGKLEREIAQLKEEKADLEKVANNTVTSKYFNFKSV